MNKTTQKTMFSSNKNNWETPQILFNTLNDLFHFTLDLAASDTNHKCVKYYTEQTNGLIQDLSGERVFCNPPYGRLMRSFLQKTANDWSLRLNIFSCFFIPARTETKALQNFVFPCASGIFFFNKRIIFEIDGKPMLDKKGRPMPAPFPSMLAFYNMNSDLFEATKQLLEIQLKMGILVKL